MKTPAILLLLLACHGDDAKPAPVPAPAPIVIDAPAAPPIVIDATQAGIDLDEQVGDLVDRRRDRPQNDWPMPATPPPKKRGEPPDFDASIEKRGLASAKAAMSRCGKGTVKLRAKVAADGQVTEVTVDTTSDPTFGECVAKALRATAFPKTAAGGGFTVPLAF